MATLHTAAEAVIDAPASTVLAVLRDFNGRHREILPPAFSNLVVEEGGVGAGTVMSFDLTLGGRTQRATSRVEEPGDGVIEEHVVGRDMVTTFTVRPDGDRTTARIETRWQPAGGLAGFSNGSPRRGCFGRSTGTSLPASTRLPLQSTPIPRRDGRAMTALMPAAPPRSIGKR